MIVNESRLWERHETSTVDFQAAGSVLSVTQPDGTLQNPAPLVGVEPNSPNAYQDFSALIAAPMAGPYNIALTYTAVMGGIDQVVKEFDCLFASYKGITGMIRNQIMQVTSAVLSDGDVDPVLCDLLRRLEVKYPDINAHGGYRGLTAETDQYWFDRALAYFGAAALQSQPQRIVQEPAVVVMERQGPIEYRYSRPATSNTESQKPLIEQWLDQAQEALSHVSYLASALALRRSSFSTFVVAGPSRRRQRLGAGSLNNPLIALLYGIPPEWTRML